MGRGEKWRQCGTAPAGAQGLLCARPRGLNRFNGPNRGAWYAAFEIETAITEVSFHLTRELDNIGVYETTVD